MNDAPLLCGIDLETTGLDITNDHITELGYVVKRHRDKKARGMASWFLYDPTTYGATPISKEINDLTYISNEMLIAHGVDPAVAFVAFLLATYHIDFFVAHNGRNFDMPFLLGKLALYVPEHRETCPSHPVYDKTKWIDSKEDIEHKSRSTHLNYLAADLGFLNPFPHAAIFDVATMLRIVDNYDIDEIIARSKLPWVILRAVVSFDQKDLAKAQRFRWEDVGDGRKFTKCWVKQVKADRVEAERAASGGSFEIVVLE